MKSCLLLLAAALLGAVGGCSRADENAPAGAAAATPGGTAVIAFAAEPDVLNPLIHHSAYSGQVLVLLQDCLMESESDLHYHPRIAESVTVAPDSLSLIVRMRPWLWSDGVPLTARDVAATWRLYVDPRTASPRAGGRIANVAAVEVLDDATLRYVFRERRADMLATLGHHILPAHVTDGLDPGEIRNWPLNQAPLSSGMFVLADWAHDRELVLERNELFPARQPLLDRVVFRIIPDETSRLAALEAGEVDFMEGLPVRAARRLEAGGDIEVHRVMGRLFGYIVWNLERESFADRRVRRALSLAIDRSVFVDGLLDGYARPAASPIPPGSWAHHADLPADPYDPAAAAALLDEAGWRDDDGDGIRERDGRPLRFTLITRRGDPVRENGAAAIRENLRRVGVDARPRVMEFSAAIDFVSRGEFDAYLGVFSTSLTVDPSPLLGGDAWDRFNYGHYAGAEADSLLRLGLSLADRDAARPVWCRYQEVIAADAPVAFLYYPDSLYGVSRRLRDVRPDMLSPYYNIEDWWIAPEDRRHPATVR